MEGLPILVAVFWTVLLVWSLMQLPALHPVQLWAIPWFATSLLYALRIIPYQPLEPLTAALIAAGGLAFAVGAILGERLVGRTRPRRSPQERTIVELAAAAASAIASLMLAAFLVEAIREVGLKPTLLNDTQLRTAIGGDSFPVTIKYVYASIAAAVLCAIAAAHGPWRRRSAVWTALSLLAVGSLYFATGRATIALAGVSAAVAAALAAGLRVAPRHMAGAAAAFGVLVLAIFFGVGELQGKTADSSELRAVPTRWDDTALSELTVPYEYATAPIAALNELVQEAPAVGGTGGCATLRIPCAALRSLGLETDSEPVIRGYTAPPLRWNTYTSLDLPLIDGGWLFAPLILLLTGIAVGAAWSSARDGSTFGVLLYSIAAFAIVYGPIQYSFLASHLVGAAVFALGLLVVAELAIRGGGLRRLTATALPSR